LISELRENKFRAQENSTFQTPSEIFKFAISDRNTDYQTQRATNDFAKIRNENLTAIEISKIRVDYLNDNLAYDKYPNDIIEYS